MAGDAPPDAPGAGAETGSSDLADVPTWSDEYLDRVSDRLLVNYDLERDRTVDGVRFELYGEMRMFSEKHFFHPVLSYGRHHQTEHLFARRSEAVDVAELERLVALGHDLADDWIEADERHFSTDFTFVTVADAVTEPVRAFVADFRDRNLLKYGYLGHYEVNLVVAAPDREQLVASEQADVAQAFRLWDPIEEPEPTLWKLITRRLQL